MFSLNIFHMRKSNLAYADRSRGSAGPAVTHLRGTSPSQKAAPSAGEPSSLASLSSYLRASVAVFVTNCVLAPCIYLFISLRLVASGTEAGRARCSRNHRVNWTIFFRSTSPKRVRKLLPSDFVRRLPEIVVEVLSVVDNMRWVGGLPN